MRKTTGAVIFLLGAFTLPCLAQPSMSRGQQFLPITSAECLRRAGLALTAEGYSSSGAGNFANGFKDEHGAYIICNEVSSGGLVVNIVVASLARDAGVPGYERQKLQARMEQPGAAPTPAPAPPPAPAPSPGPPPAPSGCRCGAVMPYCVTATSGTSPAGKPAIVVQFATPVPRYGGAIGVSDWIGLFVAGEKIGKVEWFWNENICPLYFGLPAPGKYEVRYLLDNSYDKVMASIPITVTASGMLTRGVTGLPQERTPVSGGGSCQGAGYSLTVEPRVARSGEKIAVRVTVPGGAPPEGSWVGLFQPYGSSHLGQFSYLADLKPTFTRTFNSTVPGQYEIRVLLDSGYDKVAARCSFTVQ